MSISASLNNALSGMTAASRMAEVVSSNLSNALTDGYGRRTIEYSSGALGGAGEGTILRHVDRGILGDRRLADARLGGFDTMVTTMGRIEGVLGQAGVPGSITDRIVAVESALIDAAGDPSSPIRLSSLGATLQGLTEGLNTASREVQTLRQEADASIAGQVDQLNTALRQVEQLNGDITLARNSGIDPSGLMDQRQTVIDTIATLVPVRELDRDGGQVALLSPGGELLLDGKAKQFGFVPNGTITADMTLASGALSGLTLDGAPLAADGIGHLAGGTLGATFQTRDQALVDAQASLDTIAADLVTRFQDPAVDPTLAVGQPGLLTDAGGAFDATAVTGLAGRIAVNAAVDPARGGQITNLRDGVNAVTPGPSGAAGLLQALSGALSDPRAIAGDPAPQSASGRAASLSASVGNQRLTYESELSFATARWSSLKEAEAAGGVDSDHEMQMLLRVEQAYAANARVIQAVDMMMQHLLEL
ncbi:flagellar hook-associated protein FlgK [Thalassorhabdomicrobium marinisediminis]|uniref:flagellar hook-associated protein FlgK n=1 Tax=Thalassorhabdomicrobium marinisediminis TaxID=2170577 RepID=UPI00249313B6|nr:flagellar hook-associated protein FlgK [Thalassorhabdomicrobium marinisediminis]